MKTNKRVVTNKPRKRQALRMTKKDLETLVKLSKKELDDSRKDGYQPEFL